MNNKKLMNTAKNFDTFAKICGGFARVLGIMFIVLAALLLIFGKAMYEVGTFSLDLDYMKIYLSDQAQVATDMFQLHMVIGLFASSVISFTVYYLTKCLRNILAPMKEGRPFAEDIPSNLRKIAWSVLVGGAVLQVVAIVEQFILMNAYPMDQIFSSDVIAEVEYSMTADFSFVWIFCVIMFLSYIFAYGQTLQQESDETL